MRCWKAHRPPPRGIALKLLCLSALIATSSHTAITSCGVPPAPPFERSSAGTSLTQVPWRQSAHRSAKDNNIVVFSGGTAWNGLAHAMSLEGFYCAYVLPVSDGVRFPRFCIALWSQRVSSNVALT